MRILYVSYLHPAIAPGGPSRSPTSSSRASLDAGHEAFLICALEDGHEAEYGKPGAVIVPMYGEAHQYLFFPQFYDFHHLSVGDWRSLRSSPSSSSGWPPT